MRYGQLGDTEIEVSEVGFGTGGTGGLLLNGSVRERRRVVAAALDAGMTYFDTSPIYGDAEVNLGDALRQSKRTPVVSTKVIISDLDPAAMRRNLRTSIDTSRQRLNRDRLDLVFLNDRVGMAADRRGRVLAATDVAGSIGEAMAEEVAAGRVQVVGVSGLGHTSAIATAFESGHFGAVQVYYNFLNPSAFVDVHASWRAKDYGGVARVAASHGLGVVGIRALAAGALAGATCPHPLRRPYSALAQAEVEADRLRAQALMKAVGTDLSIREFALRYPLSRGGLHTNLVGISDVSQVQQLIEAVEAGPLPSDLLERLDAAYAELFEMA